METLTGKQKRFLRGLGNRLKATVYIGQKGITESAISALIEAFNNNELVKVKIQDGYSGSKTELAEILAEKASVSLVQILGNTLLFYSPDMDEPKVKLPSKNKS